MPVRLGLLDKFELEMAGIGTYPASIAVVIDILRQEDRCAVPGAERLELFQYPYKLGSYPVEIQH